MKIKIFLASSITEFETARMSFAIYLNKLNTIFSERYDTEIVPFICEAADHKVSQKERKQDDYNEVIADSDVVIFLVGKHLGIYTNEEFKFSCDKLKENYKPKIYVYFSDNNSVDEDVIDFKKSLETVYQHYYDSFEFIDTVKLSTLFNIRKIVFPLMRIEVKDDSFYIDGKKIEQDVLSPDKIQAFYNNKEIKRLLQESCSASTDERMFIVRKINDIQNEILSVYMTVSDYAFKGIYNIRISEAARLLENGDIVGAEAALDIEHLNERREQRKKAEKRIRQEGTLADIAELQIAINILKLKNEYDDISSKYKQAVEYALNDNIGLKILYDYAVWLGSIHQVDEALKIANQLYNMLTNLTQEELQDNDISNRDLANLQVLLGVLYSRISKFQMAYSSYRKALTYWQEYLNSKTTDIELWTIAEHIEEIACFIQQVPASLSDIADPFNYSESVCVGQLAADIKRLKKVLQEKKQIDFHDLETNPIYQQGYQSIVNFAEDLSEEEKKLVIPDSVTFIYDNPIFESYILILFSLCVKESILAKTKDFVQYNKGLAMTILNVATIQNILRDYVSAEDGANLAIKILNDLVELDTNADVNEDMVQAYGVLYTSTLNRNIIDKTQRHKEKMMEYSAKAYQNHPIEYALTYSNMLFQIGMDYLHSSNYQESLKIFEKLIKVYWNIKEKGDVDETQYMISFLLSNLKWIETYSEYYRANEYSKINFDKINNHFNNAIILFNEINENDAFDDHDKANCILEINCCQLLYLPPINHHKACTDCMKQALQMCMLLSGKDIATAYNKWVKTFEIITKASQFIYFCCDSDEEKTNWLKDYYAVFDASLNFIIENAVINPLCLVPSHFRYLSDYLFYTSPDRDFLNNYETLLHLLYRFLMSSNDDETGVKQLLIEKIHRAYSQILENASSLKNQSYLMAILRKEKI